MTEEGTWMSILEYAAYRKISISTIRRYIKAGQIKNRKREGKYEIFVSDLNLRAKELKNEKEHLALKLEIKNLEEKIRLLTEENEDLRMLVSIYEKRNTPPEIPTQL
ncbi:MAG: hypothetical protein GY909_11565 [Oligoflexia bacterium]|nr:hypothetical protein [Oligoflexia bacterium]